MSGGHNCTHGRTSSHLNVDSFIICKALCDAQEVLTNVTWPNGSEATALIRRDKLTLFYRLADVDHVDTIPFDWIPRGYGGYNAYFLCPFCYERCRKLYLTRNGFQCRKCARLHYPSQQDGKLDVARWKVRRELRALCVSDEQMEHGADVEHWIPHRPKGMHWRTYYTHCKRLELARAEWDYFFMRAVARVLGWR